MKGNFLAPNKEKSGKKKKVILISISLITILVIVGGVAFFMLRKGNTMEFPFSQGGFGNMMGMGTGFTMTGDMVAASGVISVGVTEESFDVENLSEGLTIEEMYVTSNAEIQAGGVVLKLTEESVAEAREELQETLTDAELAYRAGTIEYEQSKITAEYEYNVALLSGEQAQSIYDETIADLANSVERAKQELAEAEEQIAEYRSYVDDGSYRSHFKIDEYQALYDENLEVLKAKMEEWGVDWSQVTGGMGVAPNSEAWVLSKLYQVLEQNAKDLEQAQSDYEDAVENAAFELQTLLLNLPSLKRAVAEAEESYETQIGQAKLTYEKAMASAERAQSDYETAIEKAESDFDTLKSEYEDAKENLELFESSVGDGYFYASGNGTILRTMVRAGQKLSSNSTVFMYSNPQEMSITVSVDQTDIAKLNVGDEVYIQSEAGTGYEGTISQINPVTSSESRTNVTYNVTVTLSGDTQALSANESVTVVFGVTLEDMESMQTPTGGFPGMSGQMQEGER